MKTTRTAVLAGILALAVSALGARPAQDPVNQDLAKKITFRAPAAPARALLEQLSGETGVLLTTSRTTDDQVLLIQVKDVSLQDLMKQIASVTGAAWIAQESGFRLDYTSDALRALRKAQVEMRAKQLEKALEPHLKNLAEQAEWTEEAARKAQEGPANYSFNVVSSGTGGNPISMVSQGGTGPGTRAITRLIQAIGLTTLAEIGPDTRVVFSTRANRVQRALPFGVANIIGMFINESRIGRQAAAPAQEVDPRQARFTLDMGAQGNLNLTPAKAILVVHRMGFGDGLNIQLIVGDAQGALVARGSLMLSPVAVPVVPVEVKLKNGEKPVVLSDLAAEYAKMTDAAAGGTGSGGTTRVAFVSVSMSGGSPTGDMVMASPASSAKTAALTKEWRERIVNPERYEPLAFVAGEALGKAGDLGEVNLVACLPDSSLRPASRSFVSGKPTVSGLMQAVQSSWGLKANRDGAWLTLSPDLVAPSIEYRLDRGVLGAALRSLSSQGFQTLDQRASYAVGSPIAPANANFEAVVFGLINKAAADELVGGSFSGERKMLRFYAGLSIVQRQALGAGKTVVIRNLGLGGREILTDMVYNSLDGPSVGQQGGRRPPGMMLASMFGDLANERTEVLYNGVPQDGVLSVQTSSRPVVFGVGAAGDKVAVDGPAIALASTAQPGDLQVVQPQSQYSGFVTGSQSSYTFTFQLLQNASLTRTLTDRKPNATAKPVPYNQLPADFRNRLDAMQREMQRAMQDIRIGGRSSGGPIRP